jgi:hypothetical protein
VVGSCKHDNEPSGSVKDGELHDLLSVLLASQEGLCSMEFYTHTHTMVRRIHNAKVHRTRVETVCSGTTPFQTIFQVLTAASVKMTVFWDVAPCSLGEVYRRFRGAYCLLLPDYTAQHPRRQSPFYTFLVLCNWSSQISNKSTSKGPVYLTENISILTLFHGLSIHRHRYSVSLLALLTRWVSFIQPIRNKLC